MGRDARFIARMDLSYLLREKNAIVWLFVMPILFFYFIGTVTGGMGAIAGGDDGPVELALFAPPGSGFLTDQVVRRLEDQGFAVERVASLATLKGATRGLEVPSDLTEGVLAGEPRTLRFHGEASLSSDLEEIRLRRAIYTVLGDLIATDRAGEPPSTEAFDRLEAMPRTLEVVARPAGQRRRVPSGFQQTVPGIMVMFTLIVLLSSGATLLVIERNEGLLRRLASTPIGRGDVVLGKWIARMVVGLVQVAFAMLAGTLLFKMQWGPDLPMVLVVLVAWAALCASLGLLLGSLARTEGQAVAIGVLATNVLAALGGCWWPIEITPPWMQRLADFLPTGWAMKALHRLASYQSGAASAVPYLVAIVASALVAGWLAAKRFRYE